MMGLAAKHTVAQHPAIEHTASHLALLFEQQVGLLLRDGARLDRGAECIFHALLLGLVGVELHERTPRLHQVSLLLRERAVFDRLSGHGVLRLQLGGLQLLDRDA